MTRAQRAPVSPQAQQQHKRATLLSPQVEEEEVLRDRTPEAAEEEVEELGNEYRPQLEATNRQKKQTETIHGCPKNPYTLEV